MVPYHNEHGDSGVIAYEIARDSIKVQFIDYRVYTYSNKSAGAKNIRHMKELAKSGRGLSTFISQHIKDKYEH